MRRGLKIAGITLAALVVLGAAASAAAHLLSAHKMRRFVDIDVPSLTLDPNASLERGQYLYETRGCGACHGRNGAGDIVINDVEGGLYVKAPNITRGQGSAALDYTDTDWVRLMRHGVKPSRTPVFIMPSNDYARLADTDVAAIVAYVRSLPPVAGEGAVFKLPLVVKALYAVGVVEDAAEQIDHRLPAPTDPPQDAAQIGAYVANTCIGCHGPGLSGGKIPGSPPSWPLAANLTSAPDGAMSRYPSIESFRAMFQTGRRPDGSTIREMPFASLGQMNDEETAALFSYLKSLPARPSGQR